jgi:hypothetical protein
MKQFLLSLLSRKLWLAISAAIVCVVNKDYTALAAVVIGYFTANAYEAKVTAPKV